MNPKISVIVPVYNVEKYLKRCMDSIINQSYENLDIIMIDDGSTDSSGDLCDQIALMDCRIRVQHKKNGGLSSARNVGLDIMNGEYVMFVDSDDYISEDCVQILYELILSTKSKIAIGNFMLAKDERVRFERENDKIWCMSGREAIELQFGKNTVQLVSAWAKLYQKEVFKDLRFPEGMLHEDEGTTYKALYFCEKVVVSESVVYAYYWNDESITKRPKKKNYEDLCEILKEQISFYHKYNEPFLEARVRNRFCIQAAAHYFPVDYFEKHDIIECQIKKIYKGVWKVRGIPFREKIKGLFSAYFCKEIALLIVLKNNLQNKIKL